jgi:NAD(P)H-dependent FMN reductase
MDRAREHGAFEVELVDLKAVNLPLLSEPNHPRLKQYTQATTIAWSETVSRLDAFVFVTPEYNFGATPALVNALNHLYAEWSYKAAGFVSYGGVSGGLRGVQRARQLLTAFKMVPIVEAVAIPFVAKAMDQGRFTGGDVHEKPGKAMLDELLRWTNALAVLRV